MKSRVRARSMTSRSTLVGQSHSKSAMGLNFLMADSRSRRSRLRRERSWVSSWASCSSSMRGDQRALVARARKSSRLAGRVLRPMCLSCAGRLFVGLMVLVGELIVGLQIVRGDIERLQFRVAAEIHGDRSGVLLGTLPPAQDERYRRSAWGVALECFPDGHTQLGGPVGIQELEELCGLAARRFSPCESGIEQSLAFRHRLRQATTWGGSEGLALFLQQGLLVSGDRARAGVDHRSGDVGRSAYYRPGSVPSRRRPPGSADVRWPPAGWSSRSGRNEGKWSYPRGSGEPDRSRTGVSVKEAVVVVLR